MSKSVVGPALVSRDDSATASWLRRSSCGLMTSCVAAPVSALGQTILTSKCELRELSAIVGGKKEARKYWMRLQPKNSSLVIPMHYYMLFVYDQLFGSLPTTTNFAPAAGHNDC